jgi:GDP-mannose 6-dehydrogenase
MRINIYGLGYVGCVSAACLANNGFDVTGIDIDKLKVDMINKGRNPIVEPGLQEAIKKAVASKKLRAAINGVGPAEISIVCVGTPSNDNGSLQLQYIKHVAEQIGNILGKNGNYHVVNIRSTVLPGTVEEVVIPILEEHAKKKAGKDFGICMNPEFMREGTSINDYFHPPFTVIGQIDKKSGDVIEKLYSGIQAPLFKTAIKAAEIVKYSCNAFHALKIGFANEIGNACKLFNIDSHEVMKIFCEDKKLNISPVYLKPGFAFGGSCLPKDLRALLHKAKERDLQLPILESILESNSHQIEIAYKLIAKTRKRRIGLLGLSFKPDTDDLRESPMVELAEKLIGKGYNLTIYDREVSIAKIYGSNKKYIERVIPHISSLMEESLSEVIKKSEMIVVTKITEEIEKLLAKLKGNKIIIDLAKLSLAQRKRDNGGYEGICW